MTSEGKIKDNIKVVHLISPIFQYHMPVPAGYAKPALDFIGFYFGYYCAIEAMQPGKKPTGCQDGTIADRQAAGGKLFVIDNDAGCLLLQKWLNESMAKRILIQERLSVSGIVDLPLVMLQKAQHAAEAAAASAKLLETEAGLRLTSIEARMVAVEGRMSSLYAGQGTQTLALMRIADTQSEHTVRFDAIDKRFDAIDKRFDAIETMLAGIAAKLP